MEETQLRPLEAYELKLRESVETKEDEIRGLMAKLIQVSTLFFSRRPPSLSDQPPSDVQDMRAHAAGETVAEVSIEQVPSDGNPN